MAGIRPSSRINIFSGIFFCLMLVMPNHHARAEEMPEIPDIKEAIKWEINEIPTHVTVYYANGLKLAYPWVLGREAHISEEIIERKFSWVFKDCGYMYQVSKTPTAYRWGIDEEFKKFTPEWVRCPHYDFKTRKCKKKIIEK